MLKAIVILLAILAAAKVGHREYLYRSATNDVIVQAYRERAVQACQLEPRGAALGLKPSVWSTAAAPLLVIGKPSLDVYFWQIDHAMWNARFRNPYLFLRAVGRDGQRAGGVLCEYDIVNGAAMVSRL